MLVFHKVVSDNAVEYAKYAMDKKISLQPPFIVKSGLDWLVKKISSSYAMLKSMG